MTSRSLKFSLMFFCLLLFSACRQSEPLLKEKSNVLRISVENDPQTLDPRLVRDLSTVTVMQMLHEGLMRTQPDGQATPALAESMTISPDQKTYTFHLRPSAWSNGDPITAKDFAETWKSTLNPQFSSPNAYQLYVIKGAQSAKEGSSSLDNLGVQTPNDSTLIVELEQPTPYFPHLTATHFFYPVHSSLRQGSGTANALSDSTTITSGPFKLEKWNQQNELTAIPNPYYWDRENVHLDRIQLVVLDNPTALQLFLQGGLDWTGSPLSTLSIDALSSLKEQKKLEVIPSAGLYLFRVNTEKPPFDQVKMRQAFALALNRADLVEYVLQGNQEPAFGLVPYSLVQNQPFFDDHNVELARRFLKEALEEKALTIENLPKISIQYASGERAHKIAQVAQQQWKEALGVEVVLESNEPKVHYDRLKNHNYQLAIGSWFADFNDPISFLEIFKLKDNGTNNTQWENPQFINLLNASAFAKEANERKQLLRQAEQVIMNEMPVIPLFYSSYNYVKNPLIKGVYFSQLGYLDFKNAFWDHEE